MVWSGADFYFLFLTFCIVWSKKIISACSFWNQKRISSYVLFNSERKVIKAGAVVWRVSRWEKGLKAKKLLFALHAKDWCRESHSWSISTHVQVIRQGHHFTYKINWSVIEPATGSVVTQNITGPFWLLFLTVKTMLICFFINGN